MVKGKSDCNIQSVFFVRAVKPEKNNILYMCVHFQNRIIVCPFFCKMVVITNGHILFQEGSG